MPDLTYTDTGSGDQTIVLLHGVMFDHTVFDELADHLSHRHRVLAIDLPGFGGSPMPTDYSYRAMAADVAGLIRQVGDGPATALGWSMGATVALGLALEHRDVLDRLILVGATPCFMAQPDWPWGYPPDMAQGLLDLLTRDRTAGVTAFVDEVVGHAHPLVRDRLLDVALRSRPEATLGVLAASAAVDLRADLAQITTPAHVIAGAVDHVCPPEAGAFIAQQLDATLAVVPHGGHAAFLTQAARFRQALDNALRDENVAEEVR